MPSTSLPSVGRFNLDDHDAVVVHQALVAFAADISNDAVRGDIEPAALKSAAAVFLRATAMANALAPQLGAELIVDPAVIAMTIAEGDAPKFAAERLREELTDWREPGECSACDCEEPCS